MAKRFTDTGKWDKAWFRKLSPKLKCAYEFLRDRCDLAGVWDIDLDALEFFVGERVTLEEMRSHFQLQILSDNKLFLPGFIEFQYGDLSETCKPHLSVIKRLKKLTLWEGYTKGIHTLEDKDKDKDQEKEKDQERKGGVGEKQKFDFEALYKNYPRKEGKKDGIAYLKRHIKTPESYAAVAYAIKKYSEHVTNRGTEPQFIKLFSSFVSSWEDWLDPETGTTIVRAEGLPLLTQQDHEDLWRDDAAS